MTKNQIISTNLGEVVDLFQGLAINAKTKYLLSQEGLSLWRIKDLIDGQPEQYIDSEKAPQKSIVNEDDVIVTRTGQVGLVFRGKKGVLHNNSFKVVPNETILTKRYLYWFLTQSRIYNYLNQIASGSVQKDLKHDLFKSVHINIPPIADQNKISDIFDTLDKRIELNKKTNETLEGIAKALFKSWFIDFDPVKAKVEGRSNGLSDEISDLFPDSFEDSELGQIPKGWEISKLGNIVLPCGKSIKSSKKITNKPYVPIDCISSKSLTLTEYKPSSEAKSSLLEFRKGDILFGAMRPYFHKVCIAPFDGITRSTCIPLREIETSYHAFSTFTVSNKETIEYATKNSTGSTIPYIRWNNNLENMKIKKPPKHISKCFENIIEPFLEKFCTSILFEKNLKEMRNILLPKLITGELKISVAEKIIEEVEI